MNYLNPAMGGQEAGAGRPRPAGPGRPETLARRPRAGSGTSRLAQASGWPLGTRSRRKINRSLSGQHHSFIFCRGNWSRQRSCCHLPRVTQRGSGLCLNEPGQYENWAAGSRSWITFGFNPLGKTIGGEISASGPPVSILGRIIIAPVAAQKNEMRWCAPLSVPVDFLPQHQWSATSMSRDRATRAGCYGPDIQKDQMWSAVHGLPWSLGPCVLNRSSISPSCESCGMGVHGEHDG
eukprot:XP_022271887.1 uncharacterized protein LOC111094852 [Canis lupus familiaris]